MLFTKVCRTCLTTKSVTPIFHNIDDHTTYASAVYIATSVKIELDDGLPQNICDKCLSCLYNTFDFQKKCKDSEIKLLEMKKNLSEATIKTEPILVDTEHSHFIIDNKVSKHNSKKRKKTLHHEVRHEKKNLEEKIGVKIETPETVHKMEADKVSGNIKTRQNVKRKQNHYDKVVNKTVLENDLKFESEDDQPLHFLIDNDDMDVNVEYNVFHQDPTDIVTPRSIQKSQNNIDTKKGPKPDRVKCKICEQELSIRSIDSHMTRRHPGADKRRVKCELCDNYVMKQKLNRHMKLMHASDHRCRYCNSECASKESLIDHVKTCAAKKKRRKPYETGRELRECDVCHKTMQKASLRMHKAIKHAGMGPVCVHCSRRFSNKFRLGEHLRAKHGYEKFKCGYCDFQCAAQLALKNHERRHRGDKPYMCEQCGANFHAAYLLSQHRQSHRTEKLLKCNQCPATFKANNNLHMHKMTCHSSVLFKCPMCSRGYSCRHYVVKHLRHVHLFRGPVPALQTVHTPIVTDDDKSDDIV